MKEYYTIGFEEEVFKVPKKFLNQYKRDATILARKEVLDDIEKEAFKLGGNITKITVNDIIDIVCVLKEKHLNTDSTEKVEKQNGWKDIRI